jgi:cell division protein FtsA
MGTGRRMRRFLRGFLHEMIMKKRERIVCALDVGTWKTCLVMTLVRPDGEMEILASGLCESGGLAKGIIVNFEAAVDSIRRVVEKVESETNISVDWVVAGISGNHIKSNMFRDTVDVQGKNGEVMVKDMDNAVQAALIPLSCDREIIHLLPLEFFMNGHGGIKNPVGLVGPKLDIILHVVSCDSALSQSLVNAANKSNIEVKRIILQSIASGEAVLTPEEKELGTMVIDIGGGTTDIAVYLDGSVCFSSVIPVGGAHFTGDLVELLRTSRKEAERLKIQFGSVLPEQIESEELVTIERLGMRGSYDFSRKEVCEYLYCRGAELLGLVKDEVHRSGMGGRLTAGAVLTGGGSLMHGIAELAERVLEMPVRQGIPFGLEGLTTELMHPNYACAIGLAIFEAQRSTQQDLAGRPSSKCSLADKFLSWFGG